MPAFREWAVEVGGVSRVLTMAFCLETQNTFFVLPHTTLLKESLGEGAALEKMGVGLCFINRRASTCEMPFCCLLVILGAGKSKEHVSTS